MIAKIAAMIWRLNSSWNSANSPIVSETSWNSANNAATPLERPKQLADKVALTDEEVAEFQAKHDELFDGEGEAAGRVVLVVGSISSAPVLLDQPCRILEQDGLGDGAIEASTEAIRNELGELTNLYARATYKKQLAKVLVKRAVEALREQV